MKTKLLRKLRKRFRPVVKDGEYAVAEVYGSTILFSAINYDNCSIIFDKRGAIAGTRSHILHEVREIRKRRGQYKLTYLDGKPRRRQERIREYLRRNFEWLIYGRR